ncbi:unnamed protein product [Cylindrotheca closterium]|uniref:FAD-binding domain-containing protein n=1 Tax=Cylindrotheca closterium TaxID=2856 RepID=A0AAD2JLX8_9STRA|nr:unnamed protein product [Cylindrotheca closterium]
MTKTTCPKCRGEGKIRRPPSKKARLKHQRQMQQEQEQKNKGGDDNDDTPNDSKRVKLTTPPLPPRLEPCKTCNQTGIIDSLELPNVRNDCYPSIAIVGGGLGGLALGIACSHRGIPFQVFERDTSFLMRKQGYGLTLQQASRALAAFGIESLQDGLTSTKHIVHTTDGTPIGEWGLRKWGRDQDKKPPKRQNVHIARQALRRELLDALGGEERVSWGHKLMDMVVKEDEKYTLSFQKNDGSIVQHEADMVVGADGIRSTVRKHLLESTTTSTTEEEGDIVTTTETETTATPLRYLDCLVVLGICSLNLLDKKTTTESELLDGQTVFQTADGSTRIYLMPYSSTAYMWQLSFPMKDEALAKEISNNGPTALKQEALERCRKWHSPIPEILEKTPVDLVSGYPVYDRDLITLDLLRHNGNNDSKKKSAMTLIGDAAHPMSPFKGQGANQALLDAISLARSIVRATHKRGDAKTDIPMALDEYHAEMVERTAVKVQASAEAAQFLHSSVAIQKGNVTRGAAAASSAQQESILKT